MTGTITRLIHVRGYGFITDEHGQVRFLHALSLADSDLFHTLRVGQRVVFDPVVRPSKTDPAALGAAHVVVVGDND